MGMLVIGPALTSRGKSPSARRAQVMAATERDAAAPTLAASIAATRPMASARPAIAPILPTGPASSSSAETAVRSIERETVLLAEAQRALGRNDATAALGVLDVYAREFPGGALSEEASAAGTVSWCSLGRQVEGLRALGNFRTSYPGSPLQARVMAACSNLSSHDDFELESARPSTQSSKR